MKTNIKNQEILIQNHMLQKLKTVFLTQIISRRQKNADAKVV